MWFILLILAAVAFYLNKTTNRTVKCNVLTDNSCKMYNQRDIQSKCSSLCLEQNPKYVFTGTHSQVDNENICECNYPEKFTLDFSNVTENPDILPDIIPNDIKFSDRNYLEKEQERRHHNLIFGLSK
jgi:hypothetical protein